MIPALRRGAALLLFATFTTSALPARAEEGAPSQAAEEALPSKSEMARAQGLFNEAAALTGEGKFQEACDKLEQSYGIHPGAGTGFNLGRCWQKIGRTASAFRMFEAVAEKTKALGQPERERAARERMEALLPQLSRLRIEVSAPGEKTEVRRDGQLLPRSEWEKPTPVDPGPHDVSVSAPGKQTWSTKLDVKDAGTIAVLVPALVDEKPPAPALAPAIKTEPKAAARPKQAPPPEKPSGNAARTWGLVAGGVGIASAAGAIVMGARYLSKNGDAKDICPAGINCTQAEIVEHEELVEEARTARTWAFIGGGVAVASLATASYLLFFAPSGAAPPKTGKLELLPRVDSDGTWGASLIGAF